ncbi:MAG TPA: tripartite tricarboxylate transporter permease [Burkholderiaceae bacterium]|nr:tripartite tricarboxylate transporter permease [Burkholderiaceae bacterium]
MTDTLLALAGGFAAAVSPMNLAWALAGCFLGTAIGVLPGIGPALTVAMLLPLTSKVEPSSALILFAGVYYGAMFGGSTTSVLMNTPGESATMVTALEGNAMARDGRAGPALATAAIGSFVAGTVSTVLLTLSAPLLASVALRFGPAEYFAVMVFAFTTVSAVLGASVLKGLTSLLAGLAIGLVGIDQVSGTTRFTLGIPELFDGIDVVVVAVGLFAVGETLHGVTTRGAAASANRLSPTRMSREDWRRSLPAWLRGTAIGFPFGLVPAGGAEIPTFVSYATEKRLSKRPQEFSTSGGRGAIEGVAGPEAANNASVTAALAPLLTLGIPTSATTAILLAAFQNYSLQPGPTLLQTSGPLVWTLIASLYVGNAMLLVLNLPLIGLWVRVLRVPPPLLHGGILVFSTLGAYSIRQSWFDLALLLAVGLVGLGMRRFGFPTTPVIVGMILGPIAEKQLRNALSISQGDWSVFATRPLSLAFLAAAVAVPLVPRLVRRRALRTRETPWP